MEHSTQIEMEMLDGVPSWLETPPSAEVGPPAQTRVQELPFDQIRWEDFEKLCLRMVKSEANVEFCTLYGRRGQKQHGIDIYARKHLGDKCRVYQCKHAERFEEGDIKASVRQFLEGEWVDKSDTFVLCTSASLRDTKLQDTLEEQSKLLKEREISLIPWDKNELNLKLKDYPNVVDDFFGREWVKAFCGEDKALGLGTRLDGKQVTDLRRELGRFYGNVFNIQDPGLLPFPGSNVPALPLENRYVLPDVYENQEVRVLCEKDFAEEANEFYKDSFRTQTQDRMEDGDERDMPRARPTRSIRNSRRSVESWLLQGSHSVLLGDPGSGKTSLLRFLAIDLLNEEPKLTELARKFQPYLPIWVPFGLWTTIIDREPARANSLQDILRLWLERWNEGRLWPLVGQALQDDRLLLLVDGLDEWTNLATGQIALDKLQVFVRQRNLPAILTSRPLGFSRLGMQSSGWQVAELAEFSGSQQEELSRTYFEYWITSVSGTDQGGKNQLEAEIVRRHKEFLSELTTISGLAELAKTPLLLVLLVYLWLQKSKLPRDRFKAYSELTDHLIAEHPRRRRADISQADNIFLDLAPIDIKNILAHLAYTIQRQTPEGVVKDSKAKQIVITFLQDDQLGFGYRLPEAKRSTSHFLDIAEAGLGLLVRKSPSEIGFYHRSFLEYLAACHISRLPLEEQLNVVRTYFSNAQWREVILALFRITERASDVQLFAKTVKESVADSLERYSANALLSEVAFGHPNCPAHLARTLANECFQEIELGSWMPQRKKLLESTLSGLRTARTRELVKAKLTSWFPARIREFQDVFAAMETWPKCPEVIECLLIGIYNEHARNKLSSAMSLARVAEGDTSVGDSLAGLAKGAVNPQIRAGALQALISGWPEHKDLNEIIRIARKCICPELAFAAVFCSIEQGRQSESDRDNLLHWTNLSGSLDYYWRAGIPRLILKGWPNCAKTKELCLKTVRSYPHGQRAIDYDCALEILLEGYAQDDDVADCLADEIQSEEHPFGMNSIRVWEQISKNFEGHPKLVETIDKHLTSSKVIAREPELSFAALVGRTEIGKKRLLSMLDSGIRFWVARSLLNGWGAGDDEVGPRLRELACGPAREASTIGHLFPQIIEDEETCRARLIELLEHQDCSRPDFIVEGLMKLGNLGENSFVVDKILDAFASLDRDAIGSRGAFSTVIVNCAWHPRVRELAKDELGRRLGAYAAVARAYGTDEEIRSLLIKIVTPLPSALRLLIARKLGDELENRDFALSLLKRYDLDTDASVKTEASVSYHKLLSLSGRDATAALEALSKDIMCYGPDYEERRQAAFCGLLMLDHLDIMRDMRERLGEKDKICSIPLRYWDSNLPLVRQILESWEKIRSVFGDEFWDRINRRGGEDVMAWENFCPFADRYPAVKQEAIAFVRSVIKRNKVLTQNVLSFLAKAYPRSELLAACCLDILCPQRRDKRHASYPVLFLAARLLGEQFGGSERILGELTREVRNGYVPEYVLLALCYGWPDSQELEQGAAFHRKDMRGLDYEVALKLCCLKKSSIEVFDLVRKIIKDCESDTTLPDVLAYRNVSHSIVGRLQEDKELSEMLEKRLYDNPTPSEKASFPGLLSAANGLSEELRKWSMEEVNRQLDSDFWPEVGVDLVASKSMPVAYSLLALLQP